MLTYHPYNASVIDSIDNAYIFGFELTSWVTKEERPYTTMGDLILSSLGFRFFLLI